MKLKRKFLEESIKSYNYKMLMLYCNHDVTNLTLIIKYITNLSCTDISEILFKGFDYYEKYSNDEIKIFMLQTWALSCLSNPFDFSTILSISDRNKLISFVIENVIVEKLSIKIYVKLIKIYEIFECTKFDKLNILKEYSKISKIDKNLIEQIIYNLGFENGTDFVIKDKLLCKKNINYEKKVDLHNPNNLIESLKISKSTEKLSDGGSTVLSLINKFKILSHQYIYYPDIITSVVFFKYLNYNNFKFGYSLSRSFLRVLKHYDVQEVSDIIHQNLDTIFSNEILWINCFHILGSLIFKNYSIKVDEKIIETGLFFNQDDTNYRSVLVREYSLFLIYSMFRTNPNDYLKNLLIFKCVFDNNYKIRMIAGSILSSFFNIDLKTKRMNDLLETYDKLLKLYDFKIFKYFKYSCTNIEVLELQNNIILKYNMNITLNYPYRSILYYINEGLKIKYSKKYNREIMNIAEFIILDIKTLYKYRFIEHLINLYLDILVIISQDNLIDYNIEIIQNIQFLLSKNITNDLIYKIIWSIDSSVLFEYIFKNRIKTNKNIIIGNFKNKKYIDKIILEYKKKIKDNTNFEYITNIYKGIQFLDDIQIFKKEIFLGLENYVITSRGDVCYEIRLECIKLITYNQEMFNKYLVRYLLDKNKYIRDYLFSNLENYKDIIFNYNILKSKNIIDILINFNKFDKYNVTIGLLGYLNTTDNYEYDKILDIFIINIDTFDLYIRSIISNHYERVYNYIYKIIVILYNKNATKCIFSWLELLKDYDHEKYKYIQNLKNEFN